jgi:twitching motility protein PilT
MADAEIHKLLRLMEKYGASDLHLKAGSPPIYRVAGSPRPIEAPAMRDSDIRKLLWGILDDEQKRELVRTWDLDLGYSLENNARFRINAYMQRGMLSMAVRRVNTSIPDFKSLNLPSVVQQIAQYEDGLVLVCGVTGSGKSTTLASMIEYINNSRRVHIVTLEDPIEYQYTDKKAFINQREVGIDVKNFGNALKSVVRQDPDVILLGELRDPDTFATALTASETGHLVFGTLHSSTVPQTFNRVMDMFPPERKELIRQGLSYNLRAVICQRLLPGKAQGSRIPCTEVLINKPASQKLIREGREQALGDFIKGQKEEGMHDFNQSLVKLAKADLISNKVALENASSPEAFKMAMQGIELGADRGIIGR